MAIASATGFVDAVRRYRLLGPDQLPHLNKLQADFPDPRLLAKQLVQRGWLTPHQANQVLAGRGAELLMDQYIVLEPLGEGGNGAVFKARHQFMNRIVALKLLRKELLADQEAVGRFYREIEAVSQISHPNIVHAFDAGPVGTQLVLAMEYVEGCDLEQLVTKSGPLPPAKACDYIRQAALGLQHAHERGLVHRDMKPANLLVNRSPETRITSQKTGSRLSSLDSGVVKILDLGLARLCQPLQGSRSANLTILAGGSVMQGTPDYMAPEQALDFHSADIRADIYSLGCTLFFLLTGRPPFPTGSLAQKLMAHQQAEPQGMVELRQRFPAEIVAILQKMLAKKPADRFQTPGAVAQRLAELRSEGQETGHDAAPETLVQQAPAGPKATAVRPPHRTSTPARSRRRRLAFLVCGCLLLAALGGALLLFRPAGTPAHPAPTSPLAVLPTGGTRPIPANLVTVAAVSSRKPYDTATAQVSVRFWIDRSYTITAITPALDGGILVRGANDDKNVNKPDHLTLTLSAPALVYVAYDRRGSKLPAWLTDGTWQPTAESVSGSGGDADASPFKAHVKRFPAGQVVLGGNKQPPAAGAGSNYIVIVKPAPE